jgi:DNA-binding response OmpR family regulator
LLAPTGPKTVFVVEGVEKTQNALREKLKGFGFRVLISQDPLRAKLRYREQPYHALIMDAGTAGEDGLDVFKKIIREADANNLSIAAILMLAENQAEWADEVPQRPNIAVMVRPINLRQLYTKLNELTTELVPE